MLEETVVKRLIMNNQTIASMESCSGGAFCNAITNVEGASNVFKFSAITYSNEYKVRLGVDRNVIEEYSVNSIETARDMAFKITFFAESTYGIGITGRFNSLNQENKRKRNTIYVSIYCSRNNKYYDLILKSPNKRREKCKEYVIKKILEYLLKIIDE